SAPPSSSKSIASFIFLFFSVFILVTYIFLLTNIGSTIIYTIFDKDSKRAINTKIMPLICIRHFLLFADLNIVKMIYICLMLSAEMNIFLQYSTSLIVLGFMNNYL
ncbi:MAG: hypothetical protein ACRY3E_04375, partial [Candidatus Lariskella arthropodorum]